MTTTMAERLSEPVGLEFLDLDVQFEGFAATDADDLRAGITHGGPGGCESDTLNCGSVSGCQNTSSSFTRCQICT